MSNITSLITPSAYVFSIDNSRSGTTGSTHIVRDIASQLSSLSYIPPKGSVRVNTALIKLEIKNLNKILQKNPNRTDIKLKIIQLQKELKLAKK